MATHTELKKVLKPVHLWAIAVGLVISGEYFGWNYGWGIAGTIGFLIATLIVTVFYITFIFSYTELTTAIPHAGGAFAYAYRALGPVWGLIAGYATLVDFLLATPAIAAALGSYIHFLYPSLPVVGSAMVFNLIFMLVNIWGVKESAVFSLVMTVLAVAELLLFMGLVGPHFKTVNYMRDAMPFGWSGVFAALPFAVWFYLAIEGVAMVAEEVKEPKRNIPRGYISGIVTLVLLAMGVMILTGGITNWHKLSNIDYPLPQAIATVLGSSNSFTKIFAGIGLFGLVASFHGTIMASSRQLFAMARSGYFPKVLAAVSPRFKTPHWAIVLSVVISFVALWSGQTNQIITLSVMGAVLMYLISMVSVFALRIKEPNLKRPFASPFYPVFPAVALILSAVILVAIVYYDIRDHGAWLSLIFFGLMFVIGSGFMLTGKHRITSTDDVLLQPAGALLENTES